MRKRKAEVAALPGSAPTADVLAATGKRLSGELWGEGHEKEALRQANQLKLRLLEAASHGCVPHVGPHVQVAVNVLHGTNDQRREQRAHESARVKQRLTKPVVSLQGLQAYNATKGMTHLDFISQMSVFLCGITHTPEQAIQLLFSCHVFGIRLVGDVRRRGHALHRGQLGCVQ